MKKIALVSVTLNAVNPMTAYLSEMSEIHVVNYLDSYILEKVRNEGKVTDDCMRRMFSMLAQACEDGADGIIITCTIFSAYVEQFQKLLSVPVIGADTAMMEMVGIRGGKTAMLCTFKGTEKPSANLLRNCFEVHKSSYELETFVLEEAYEAAQHMDLEKHDCLIKEKIQELDDRFDNIILAQISMSNAAKGLETNHAKIFTSPAAAYETLKSKFR